MEDITDAGYKHAKRVCKRLEIIKLGEYDEGNIDRKFYVSLLICSRV